MRTTPEEEPVRLDLEGMACASCVARIERKLNKLEGVEASVNFATEQATVRRDEDVPVERLIETVESAGYGARIAPSAQDAHRAHGDHAFGGHQHEDEPFVALTRRLAVAVVLTLPLALVATVPTLQFSGWEWLALVLSTPVVFYAGLGFHRAALRSARHLEATMDTLISLGTLA
ncbi:MAG TPA: cation transporter, partial [Gaiellaceae bacterium]|nr:cation transporter [Gaiellaceae bacterium]